MIPSDTIGSTLSKLAAALSEAGFDEARRRARRLLAVALGLTPEEVFARADRIVTEDKGLQIAALLKRALAHEPLSRIQGTRSFWGLDFVLSPDTLDPRPETETLVEAIVARLTDRDRTYRFLDLGTGTGCLLLALLSDYPQATGIGVDRAEGAVATARRNAERLGCADRVSFEIADWGAGLEGRFDIVVSNPPYIETGEIPRLPLEVRDFDPRLALDGGTDGLAVYRRIAGDLPRLLAPGGIFVCEIGMGQEMPVTQILAGHGLAVEAVVPDLAGIARCVVARVSV
jgi:release factor glutamine methyltransferase